MLPLLLPVIGYLFLCPTSGQGCSQGNLLWYKVEQLFCRLRGQFSPYWGLFFLVIFGFSCLRFALRLLNYHLLLRRCRPVAAGEAPVLEEITAKLAGEAGLIPPRLYWCEGKRYPVCFTFGFRKAGIDLFQKTISLFEEHNINPRVFSEVYDCNSMASFVGAQLGIAIMPKMPSFDSFEITAIPFRDKTVTRTISLLWNNKIKPNRALKSFLDYCHSLNKNKGTRKKTLYRELGATK